MTSPSADHRCPICKSRVVHQEAGARTKTWPFCTERCRLIDLGNWLGDKYAIPGEPVDVPSEPRDPERD